MQTFALNHMVAPHLGLRDFFALAARLGLAAVEIRNDLPIALDPIEARDLAQANDITILSINALQKFNHWDDDRARQAVDLADQCQRAGAQALVLVADNSGAVADSRVRVADANNALTNLAPVLRERGLLGFVECLGFETCSLRLKSEGVEAIGDMGDVFKLTHDTFHHHLAGEADIFPQQTGLAHISGVEAAIAVSQMRDGHRVLVGPHDRLDNLGQIAALQAAGYRGPLSFEPFAPIADSEISLKQSMTYISEALAARAA